MGEVAQLFVGGGTVGAAAKAGKAANFAGKAGKAAGAAGKAATTAGKIGKGAKLADEAADAGKLGKIALNGNKVEHSAFYRYMKEMGLNFEAELKKLNPEKISAAIDKKANNIAKYMDKNLFSKYKINVYRVDAPHYPTGKVKEFVFLPDDAAKTLNIYLERGIALGDKSVMLPTIKHALAHIWLVKSDKPWKIMGLNRLPAEVRELILKTGKETTKSFEFSRFGYENIEYLADYANLKFFKKDYLKYLKNIKYKDELEFRRALEKADKFFKEKVDRIANNAINRVEGTTTAVFKAADAGKGGKLANEIKEPFSDFVIDGKAGHAGLPVIGMARAGGAAAARAVKIPGKVENILVNGERVSVSRAITNWSGKRIASDTLTNLQKSHLGMVRGEIGKGARAYNVKLGRIEYRNFGKKDAWARSSYDTLFIDQKTSAAELIRRGTLSHEFAHLEIAQKRFASKFEFNNRPRALKESYLAETEADALINVRGGKGVFRDRVELLVGESEAYDAAKLLDGIKLNQKEIENVIANELLAIRTGDGLLIKRAQGTSKLLVDKGLITREQYAQLQTSMNNWLKNTIDKGRIGNKAAAEERIAELFDIFKSTHGESRRVLAGNSGRQISKDVKIAKTEGFVMDKPRSMLDKAADKVKNFFGRNNVL